MKEFTLEKKVLILEKTKKTSAKFWKDINVGDILHFKVKVKWRYSDDKEKIEVIVNDKIESSFTDTFVRVINGLSAFEFEEINQY